MRRLLLICAVLAIGLKIAFAQASVEGRVGNFCREVIEYGTNPSVSRGLGGPTRRSDSHGPQSLSQKELAFVKKGDQYLHGATREIGKFRPFAMFKMCEIPQSNPISQTASALRNTVLRSAGNISLSMSGFPTRLSPHLELSVWSRRIRRVISRQIRQEQPSNRKPSSENY